MNKIIYLVSFKFGDDFSTNCGNCTVFIEKGDYSECEVLDLFVENIRTTFNLEKEQEIVITNIINLEKIRRELEE
jgi:hypothetical protein